MKKTWTWSEERSWSCREQYDMRWRDTCATAAGSEASRLIDVIHADFSDRCAGTTTQPSHPLLGFSAIPVPTIAKVQVVARALSLRSQNLIRQHLSIMHLFKCCSILCGFYRVFSTLFQVCSCFFKNLRVSDRSFPCLHLASKTILPHHISIFFSIMYNIFIISRAAFT